MIVLWVIGAIVLVFGLVVFRGAPYVPSHRRQVENAFDELYPLSSRDTVVDVGSGDGIVLRLARRRGARAVGYELNPMLVVISRILAGRDQKTTIKLADFWFASLPPQTTVVYCFLVSRDTQKMTVKLQQEADRLGRPIQAISYGAMLDVPAIKALGAHRLYQFVPRQTKNHKYNKGYEGK